MLENTEINATEANVKTIQLDNQSVAVAYKLPFYFGRVSPSPLYPLFTTSLVRIQKTIIADIVCPNERRPGPQVVNIIEAFISYDVI